MATVEEDDKKFGVAAEQKWKETVRKEKKFASDWITKWTWLQEEYNLLAEHLNAMKILRPQIGPPKIRDDRTCKPIPDTSAHMIGWLVQRPEFELELYGPYIKKWPLLPPPLEESLS